MQFTTAPAVKPVWQGDLDPITGLYILDPDRVYTAKEEAEIAQHNDITTRCRQRTEAQAKEARSGPRNGTGRAGAGRTSKRSQRLHLRRHPRQRSHAQRPRAQRTRAICGLPSRARRDKRRTRGAPEAEASPVRRARGAQADGCGVDRLPHQQRRHIPHATRADEARGEEDEREPGGFAIASTTISAANSRLRHVGEAARRGAVMEQRAARAAAQRRSGEGRAEGMAGPRGGPHQALARSNLEGRSRRRR